jgi:hypothetical protein
MPQLLWSALGGRREPVCRRFTFPVLVGAPAWRDLAIDRWWQVSRGEIVGLCCYRYALLLKPSWVRVTSPETVSLRRLEGAFNHMACRLISAEVAATPAGYGSDPGGSNVRRRCPATSTSSDEG